SLGHITNTMLQPTDRNGTIGSDDSITMVMVVILFLCCNILALIVNVIETFFEPSTLLLNFLTDTSNFLVVLNSSINCLIYYTFNKEYKKVFLIKVQTVKRQLINKYLKTSADRTQNTSPNSTPVIAQFLKKNSPRQGINNAGCLEILLDNDAENVKSRSGWVNTASIKDDTISKADTVTKRWVAEIQIEHRNESDTLHPRIYVLPLRKYVVRNVSITTL
ncbi:hypothetical protein WUBG_10438, partial [Wuchereria bancrofti]